MQNREELAWAAGLYDGEGCTYFRANKNSQLSVNISQTNDYVLERFKKAVCGLGAVRGPYLGRIKNGKPHKQFWQYRAGSFESAQAVLVMLWKWLSPTKREQALSALTNYQIYLHAGQGKRRGIARPSRPWSPERFKSHTMSLVTQ